MYMLKLLRINILTTSTIHDRSETSTVSTAMSEMLFSLATADPQ